MSALVTFDLNDKNIGSATLRYDGKGTTSYWTDKIGRYFYDSSLSPGDNILKSSFDYYQTGTSPDGFIDARHDFTIKHPSRPAVNGVCGEKAYVCNSGEANSRTEDISKYAWSCVGSDGGSSSACVETKPPVVNIYFSDANNQALNGVPSDNN